MQLREKVAIVTGGAQGIGKVICCTLAKEGAHVVVCDVNEKAAQATTEEIKGKNLNAITVKADVSCANEVNLMVKDVLDKLGRIDILVNNAGICFLTPLEEITEEEWDRVMDVNLKGTFLCSQAVLRVMMTQKSGKIVNIASISGKVGGILTGAHYSASKAGVICLTKSLALRLAPYGINVNAVAAGPLKSQMTDAFPPDKRTRLAQSIPLGGFGEPQDMANAVLFLVSDKAKYITGEILDVNGGLLMD